MAAMLMWASCIGRYTQPSDGGDLGSGREAGGPEAGPTSEAGVPDGSLADRSSDQAATCSATGVPSTCDPVVITGCGAGVCYATKAGLVCVCPPGTAATGTACGTTVECAPGNVCAGTSPPGLCRKTCELGGPVVCDATENCVAIMGFSEIGYCAPKP